MVSCSAAPDDVDEADDFEFEDFDNMMKGHLRMIRRSRRIACDVRREGTQEAYDY